MTTLLASSSKADVLIITALDEEFRVLAKYLPLPTLHSSSNSSNFYHLGSLPIKASDTPLRFAILCLFTMGTTDAGVAAANALADLRPDIVIMFGLAGGVRGRVQLADVIVPDQIIYYELGKYTSDAIQRRPVIYQPNAWLLSRMQNIAISLAAPYDVKFGPFAVGEKVVADANFVEQLNVFAPKLLGIEMESSGVAYRRP